MTLRELANTSKYTPETIKFFLREGLLMIGRKVTERLADYSDKHVDRLELIRALNDKLGLQYQQVKEVTDLLKNESSIDCVYNAIGLIQRHMTPAHKSIEGVDDLGSLLKSHGIKAAHPGFLMRLAGTIEEASESGLDFSDSALDKLIPPLKEIVRIEMNSDIPHQKSADDVVRYSALGMYYMSSVMQQLVRIIEQTMAL